MKKIILLTILLVATITCCPAAAYPFNTDTVGKASKGNDTTKTNKQTPFNADVYIYGTMDPLPVSTVDLKAHIQDYTDKHIIALGKVYSGSFTEKDGVTMLCIGGSYPNQNLLVIIKKRNRAKFGHPETDLLGRQVGVTGFVSHYKGMLAIKLSNPKDLQAH